jgi:GT2 family glycosyltransferase
MTQNKLLDIAAFSPSSLQFPNAWIGHLPFAAWVIQEVSPKIFVELGTHSGNSYFSFCQSVVETALSTKCYAVDTWLGDEHAGQYTDDIFVAVNTHNGEHYAKFSKLLRMTFDDAVSYFSDESIELLHIDGLHTYEAVSHDFNTWLPKLAPGAVVMFHDTNVRERNFGVWKLWEELQVRYPNNLEFVHSHGLGILQLNTILDDKKLHWLQLDSPEKQQLLNYFASLGSRQLERFEIKELKQRVVNLNQTLGERDGQIANLSQIVVERDKVIAKQNLQITEQSLQITEQKRLIAKRNAIIKGIYASSSWRLTRPLRSLAIRQKYLHWKLGIASKLNTISSSPDNLLALQALSSRRFDKQGLLTAIGVIQPDEWPEIDISVVTYNSSRWVEPCVASLASQRYPLSKIHLRFVDHVSKDDTLLQVEKFLEEMGSKFASTQIIKQANLGFGAGHDRAIREGNSEYCLITNLDLEFTPDSICDAVRFALNDKDNRVASWELRQIPFEHPKYYDPVTLETNWSSHACILIRRSAYLKVGGYDKNIFMYAEDVELSYRFRSFGFVLKYVPKAVVKHFTYEKAGQLKPLQFTGSVIGNIYIRLRYGKKDDRLAGLLLYANLLLSPPLFDGAKSLLLQNAVKLLFKGPHFLRGKGSALCYFPLRKFDYDMTRDGAFWESLPFLSADIPLVTVITRTYKGRGLFLGQAIQSVLNQTYPRIELIVVEDGGDSQKTLVTSLTERVPSGCTIRFLANEKLGRSAAGNAALTEAKGNFIMFLDDDDLLFSDHIETLVSALLGDSKLSAAYALSIEVHTKVDPIKLTYEEQSFHLHSNFRQEWDYRVLQHYNFIPIQAIIFKRELYEKRGGFDTELDQLEDWNLWLRYGYGNQFKYIPKTTSIFRTPADDEMRSARHGLLIAAHGDAKGRANKALEALGFL